MQVNEQQRQLLIREAAYFLAEKRGFTPGHEQADWLAAERHVDAMLQNLQQADTALLQAGSNDKDIRRNRKAATQETSPAIAKRRPRGKALEQKKGAEEVAGTGLPESEIVSDYHAGGPLKKPSATPNPAEAAAQAVKAARPDQTRDDE